MIHHESDYPQSCLAAEEQVADALIELLCSSAKQLIAQAVEAELQALLEGQAEDQLPESA